VRCAHAQLPDRRGAELLQRSGIEPDLGQEDAEKLLLLALGGKGVEPCQDVWIDLRDTGSGLVQDEPTQVAGEGRRAERDGRAVGVAEEVGGLRERVHDRCDIDELLLDRVAVRRVAALPAATPFDRVQREAVGEKRLDEAEAEPFDARPWTRTSGRPDPLCS
jgi:hypothetical protein